MSTIDLYKEFDSPPKGISYKAESEECYFPVNPDLNSHSYVQNIDINNTENHHNFIPSLASDKFINDILSISYTDLKQEYFEILKNFRRKYKYNTIQLLWFSEKIIYNSVITNFTFERGRHHILNESVIEGVSVVNYCQHFDVDINFTIYNYEPLSEFRLKMEYPSWPYPFITLPT